MGCRRDVASLPITRQGKSFVAEKSKSTSSPQPQMVDAVSNIQAYLPTYLPRYLGRHPRKKPLLFSYWESNICNLHACLPRHYRAGYPKKLESKRSEMLLNRESIDLQPDHASGYGRALG